MRMRGDPHGASTRGCWVKPRTALSRFLEYTLPTENAHENIQIPRPKAVRRTLSYTSLDRRTPPRRRYAYIAYGFTHNSGRSCTPGGSSFPIIKGSWAKWALWGSPSSRDRDPDPRMTRDLEGTL
eukprot:scaffold69486_cov63-Phaeocystis_antarctica.AAC.6